MFGELEMLGKVRTPHIFYSGASGLKIPRDHTEKSNTEGLTNSLQTLIGTSKVVMICGLASDIDERPFLEISKLKDSCLSLP